MVFKTAYTTITEGAATVRVPVAAKVSKEMEVFYNPVMKLNRDVSVLLLKTVGEERLAKSRKEGTTKTAKAAVEDETAKPFDGFSIGSPLAGTGIRECRFLVELERGLVKELAANDYDGKAAALIRKNIELNDKGLNCDEIEVSCTEANKFLLDSTGFTYIDLDPFGTPNPFLDAAVKRLQRGGILAVTATDTSALAGTYPDAGRRKYWAEPMRNHLMHDVGLRILIRKAQLIAAQYEKALVPVYSYSKDHYMRVFLLNERRKKATDAVLRQHKYLHYCPRCLGISTSTINSRTCCGRQTQSAGPLWTGQLWDKRLARRMAAVNKKWLHGRPENQKLLDLLAAEAQAPVGLIGFYPLNLVRQAYRKMPLRKDVLLARKGVWPTHFEANAVKAKAVELLF